MNKRFVSLSLTFQPMLFVAAAFSFGILCERCLQVGPRLLLVLSAGVFLVGLFSFMFGPRGKNKHSIQVTESLILFGFVLVGGLLSEIQRLDVASTRVQKLMLSGEITPDEPVEVLGYISHPPEQAPYRVYLDVDVEQIKMLQHVQAVQGRVRFMVPLNDDEMRSLYEQLNITYGASVRIVTYLHRANHYRNPGSPDYTEFLEQRGYDASGVVKSPRLLTVLASGQGQPVLAWFYELRRRAEMAIDSLFLGQTVAILKALLLGNQYFLGRDVAEIFRTGGTFHLLVISGSHVSLLAAMLLGFCSAISRNRWFQFVVVNSVLWIYTLMIGIDQAPVVRATLMTTVALAALLVFRQWQAANALGLAAFILLLINPRELFAPGFQLTFLAVASMVLLAFPLMSRLQAIGNWRPSEDTPQPPQCPAWVRWLAEVLYWDQRGFEAEMKASPIKYRLDKTPLALRLNRMPGLQPLIRAVSLSLIVSVIVQMAMLPPMILYFHRVTFGGVVLNIVTSFLIGLLILAAFVTFAMAQMSLAWTPPFIAMTHWLVRLTLESMVPVLRFSWASFRVAEYTGWVRWVYVFYFVPLIVFAYALHRWQPFEISYLKSRISDRTGPNLIRLSYSILGVLFAGCMVGIVTYPGRGIHRPGWLTVSFLDVDQGDAIFIQFPQGTTMLIDSGGRWQFQRRGTEREKSDFVEDTLTVGETVVSNFLWKQELERVEYILPTHADADHIQGFSDIMNNFSVGRAVLPRTPVDDLEFEQFERVRSRAGVPLQFIGAGDRFNVEGVTVEVLWPPHSPDLSRAWGNDESVVLRMKYGDHAFLLTGDMSRVVESVLVATYPDLKSDVLKVPHHGSRSSSTEEFVRRVQPQYAVFSVGEHSPFGHPHQEVVERYRASGVTLLQTGKSGTITMNTNGKQLEMATFVQ